MNLNVKFEESKKDFPVVFGETYRVSDGGFERGYAEGYKVGNTEGYTEGYAKGHEEGYAGGYDEGGKEAGNVIVSLLDRTITEYSNHTLTELGSYAFSGTNIESLYLPSLNKIGEYVFLGCEKLKDMVFQHLKSIPYNGIRQFDGLVKADFWVLESIGSNGFYNCINLETLIIRSNAVCTLVQGTVLTGTKIANGTGYIYVPDNLVEQYKAATNWSTFASQIKPLSELEGST